MTTTLASFILQVLLVLTPTLQYSPEPVLQSETSEEEYAVYSALLNQKFVDERTDLLIIVDQTVAKPFLATGLRGGLLEILSPVDATTLAAFKERNKEAQAIKAKLKLTVKYTLLANDQWSELFSGDVIKGWEEFYTKNPGATGILRFSGVGFNSERNEALMYVEHGSGATAGKGDYVLLTKSEKGWKVERMMILWVA
jgi:hypothetical protein